MSLNMLIEAGSGFDYRPRLRGLAKAARFKDVKRSCVSGWPNQRRRGLQIALGVRADDSEPQKRQSERLLLLGQ